MHASINTHLGHHCVPGFAGQEVHDVRCPCVARVAAAQGIALEVEVRQDIGTASIGPASQRLLIFVLAFWQRHHKARTLAMAAGSGRCTPAGFLWWSLWRHACGQRCEDHGKQAERVSGISVTIHMAL